LRMPVLFIVGNDTGFTEIATDEFRPYLAEQQ